MLPCGNQLRTGGMVWLDATGVSSGPVTSVFLAFLTEVAEGLLVVACSRQRSETRQQYNLHMICMLRSACAKHCCTLGGAASKTAALQTVLSRLSCSWPCQTGIIKSHRHRVLDGRTCKLVVSRSICATFSILCCAVMSLQLDVLPAKGELGTYRPPAPWLAQSEEYGEEAQGDGSHGIGCGWAVLELVQKGLHAHRIELLSELSVTVGELLMQGRWEGRWWQGLQQSGCMGA